MALTRRSVMALAALTAAALPLVAHAKLADAGDVTVKFRAKGPAGMTIDGSAEDFKTEESGGKVKVSVKANTLKTGIGLRDKHLKRYLEADKCPEIKLEIDRSALKFPPDNSEVTAEVTGDFTLHCVTNKMVFKYKAKRTGSDYHVQAFPVKPIDLDDYKVKQPCYLGVCVDKKVEFNVKFKLRD